MALSAPKNPSKRDWLPLGFLIAGAGAALLAFAALLLIRLELQQPGIQYLFDASGRPDGAFFNRLNSLHGSANTLFSVVPILFAGLGYALVPASLGRERTAMRPLGWAGLLVLVVGFVCLLAAIFFGGEEPRPSDWTLYPPLNVTAISSLQLGNVSFALGLLSLGLVSFDFLASLIAGHVESTKRRGLAAWGFALCGFVFLAGALVSLIARLSNLATFGIDPLNLFLLLVSLVVVISALVVGYRRGGAYLIGPILWALAFFASVAYGGKLAMQLSQAGFDHALHDTYYVVAQTHFFVQSASLFALFAGMSAAFASIGQQLWLGILQSLLMVVGTAMSLMPKVPLGLQGMPKGYMDYPDAFATWNAISSYGTYLTAFSVVLWMIMLLRAASGSGRAHA